MRLYYPIVIEEVPNSGTVSYGFYYPLPEYMANYWLEHRVQNKDIKITKTSIVQSNGFFRDMLNASLRGIRWIKD